MALTIIEGKPGSGKTYHSVWMVAQNIENWIRAEIKTGEPFSRSLWTNIKIDIDELSKYLSEKIGQTVDAGYYVHHLDDAFFSHYIPVSKTLTDPQGKPRPEFWWDQFPENALVIIDEVHKHLGNETSLTYAVNAKSMNFATGWRNYVMEHRHSGTDIFLITQSRANVVRAVLLASQNMYVITNAKSKGIGKPINIPFSDLDIVKEAWGISTQLYTVRTFEFIASSACETGEVTSHLMSEKIFKLYQSHTHGDVKLDRPDLQLTKFGAVRWLIKKHAWHLGLKAGVALLAVVIAAKVLLAIPTAVQSAFATAMPVVTGEKDDLKPPPIPEPPKVEKPVVSAPTVAPVPEKADCGCGNKSETKIEPKSEVKTATPRRIRLNPETGEVMKGARIGIPQAIETDDLPIISGETVQALTAYSFYSGGVRHSTGDTVLYQGGMERVKKIDVKKGIIHFESGKTLRK